jgi:DNA-binding HxlR family transcriptional regulator
MVLKVRKSKAPPPPPGCPLLRCMSLLGGAWTPNVLWFLSGGPRRFGELRGDIPPISPKMLSARLRELESLGVVRRDVMPTSPPTAEYALTDLGRELLPAIEAIAAVGLKLNMRDGHSGRGRGRRAA